MPLTQDPDTRNILAADRRRRLESYIQNLDAKETLGLLRYAAWKMWAIRTTVAASDPEDLMQAAIERTLDGRRTWNAELYDMRKHLKQCMSSIAREWFEKESRTTELRSNLSISARQHPEAEAKEKIDMLRRSLRGDTIALTVLDSMLEGYKPGEAIRAFNVGADHYNAARKRIRRRAELVMVFKSGAATLMAGEERI